jgi:hypothetical protein
MKTRTLTAKMKNYIPRNNPRPGEIPLKTWLADMAEKHQVCTMAVWQRIWRYHTMPAPELRRVNSRVIFVKQ